MPTFSIIVDDFGANEVAAEQALKLSNKVVLCIAAHLPYHQKCIDEAIKKDFQIAISIDCITMFQWKILQETIIKFNADMKKNKKPQLKGLVIWNVDDNENFESITREIRDWLAANDMWVVYVNTTDIMPIKNIPNGIFVADSSVVPRDQAKHVENICDFALDQSLYKQHSIIVVKQTKHHMPRLSKWLEDNKQAINLERLRVEKN